MASSANVAPSQREDEVLLLGLARLRELLPTDWRVDPAPQTEPAAEAQRDRIDAVVTVQDPQGNYARLVIEARRRFAPRDVESVAGGRLPLLRSLDPSSTFVVVAPWLSTRTQALLAQRGVGYVDLTGNALLRTSRPAVFVRTAGAAQDPNPVRREGASLRGVVAGRVVRLLADVRPPYTATAIARATGVSIAQVSRLLMSLDREALVERGHRGLVVGVDWAGLLRRRAESYRLFETNRAQGYVSGRGPNEILRRLEDERGLYLAVTGSFAASQRAPIAAPSQLVVYVDDADRVAQALGLLPTDRGADVVLLRPYDTGVLDRAEQAEGMIVVSASQLVLDCLAGNGRMPAEGEALLDWMAQHEAAWRRLRIDDLPFR
jgi:hypothetical protein